VGLRIIQWSVISALAGFLFGFDTVVISGAEQKIQTLWELSPSLHGIVIASALYGTVLASLFGGYPADEFLAQLKAIGEAIRATRLKPIFLPTAPDNATGRRRRADKRLKTPDPERILSGSGV
jgi:MFS family permease